MDYTWSATAAFSLEGVAAGELRRMGMRDVKSKNGHVLFTATPAEAFAANMRLRTADRVYLEMGRFTAMSFEELFEGVRALPWEKILPRGAALPVTGKCARSQLMSVRDVQAITKKAIVERMKKAYRLDWLPEDGPTFAVDVHMHDNEAAVRIDSSGAGLSRRGYRTWNGEAPLRETIAAAALMLSPWRTNQPLLDPLCGTGTIAIEGALLAINRAPGFARSFDLESWPLFDPKDAQRIREELTAAERPAQAPIFASDIDEEALVLARRHAQAAGVEHLIRFEQCALADLPADYPEGGAIVTNPPYGERLGDRKSAEEVYRQMRQLRSRLPGYSLTALSAHPGFERAYGRRADKRRRLFNGRLECELLQYGEGLGKR